MIVGQYKKIKNHLKSLWTIHNDYKNHIGNAMGFEEWNYPLLVT